MEVYLDERFPTLAAVAELIDGEAERLENERETRRNWRLKAEEEARARRAHLGSQRRDALRAALESDTPVDSLSLSPEILSEVEAIQELVHERFRMKRAIDTLRYLDDPEGHASQLRDTLAELEIKPGKTDLENMIVHKLKTRWWDAQMQSRQERLADVLSKAGWPKSDPPITSNEVEGALRDALEFDLPAAKTTFETLARPLTERIAFNFKPGRDTALPDKPEWLFSYILRLVEPRTRYLRTVLQTLIDRPIDRLIEACIPTLLRVLQETYTLDSHLVSELLSFVQELETRFYVTPEVSDQLVFGLLDAQRLDELLDNENVDYVESARAILSKPDSKKIDFDADFTSAKPTFGALNAWQLMRQADYLLPLSPRQVLDAVHIPVAQLYFESLESQLEAYTRAHSALARAVGTDKEGRSHDVKSDIVTLSCIFGSASFFRSSLLAFSNELMVASSGVNLSSLISSFTALRASSAAIISNNLTREAQRHLKPYFSIDWRGAESSGAQLRSAQDGMRALVGYMEKLCSSSEADRARVFVPLATSISELIWRMVIQANTFTPEAASQLATDLESLWLVMRLPRTPTHSKNIAAAGLLLTGEVPSEYQFTQDEIDGLLRRRKATNMAQ